MEELLSKLAELDISLEARGSELDIYDPRNVLTEELLSVIRSNKPELLILLKDMQVQFGQDMPGQASQLQIPIAVKKEYYPLSYAQKRLYFLYQFDPASTAYNMPMLFRLEGGLDRERLDDTFRRLINRHASLRTSFDLIDEGPVQKIAPEVAFTIEDISAGIAATSNSITATSTAAPDFQVDATSISKGPSDIPPLLHSFVRPFDLSRAPLLRAAVVTTGVREYILCLDMHHIITDGISQAILINDFIALYKGDQLPEPELQYFDYAEWQQSPSYLLDSVSKKDFWINQFTPLAPALELPADFPRPPVLQHTGNSLRTEIGVEETKRLNTMAAREEATLFMVLLSVYTILLAKLSNREDIVVGSPTAGRHYPGLSRVVGMFINMLPLRHRPENMLTFREYVAQVKMQTLSCLDNQDYQYEELIDALKIERDASRNPLFDVIFDFAGYEKPVIQVPGLTISPLDIIQETSKFDLSLSATLMNDRILLNFEYSTGLFRKETVHRFSNYFARVLAIVSADPGIRLGDIDILPDNEKRQLLYDFNDTAIPLPADATIVSLFERQVSLAPDKTAVVYEDKRLSYRELNERADRLAHYLRSQKALAQDQIVGLLTERSLEMITAMLGIIKAGAAYLPIDPVYPRERIEYLLSDSGARLLLVDKAPPAGLNYNGEIVPLGAIADTVPPDTVTGAAQSDIIAGTSSLLPISGTEPRRPVSGATSVHEGPVCKPENLCYLIYTSGSTGKPKGVMITHRNVVNFMEGLSRNLPVKDDDCMLAVTSTSFDISVLELFWTLCKGVEVVIHPSDISLSNLDRYMPSTIAVDFSLLFFSSYNHGEEDKYKLLLESAKYADKEGFTAVWTPERHFHEFGGLYPNPSVTSAALAMITKRIALRCGSVVSPLHDPVRIAEEWAVVDNLSGGRVGLSFAPGWNPNDFAFTGADFKKRQQTMYEQIGIVQRLWEGGTIRRTNGVDKEVDIRIFPDPVQKQLPVWVTSGGTEETFIKAGAIGANILTHLLGQSLEELSGKIKAYREARMQHGHTGKGIVTIMLHTYIGDTIREVEKVVEGPFVEYLKSSIGLSRLITEETGSEERAKETASGKTGSEEAATGKAATEIAGTGKAGSKAAGSIENVISEEKKEMILKNAFRRYYQTGALIGTRATCSDMIRKLAGIGIDEIACLIDFGVDRELVLAGLKGLNELKETFSRHKARVHSPITMMQSTPSFMRMVREASGSRRFLQSLRTLLLGGEALPLSLLQKLREDTAANIYNMYGPTESTIWSCMHPMEQDPDKVLVGRPMGNTQLYILDGRLQALPAGVPGDLYIGGEGLSKGYWHRPELTAERFIVNPYDKKRLIYKTGDIARWMPDGSVELLGREDHQVKIRGYRIEPGEIEHLLTGYPGVRESVVLVRERGGERFLAAYYAAEKEIPAEELRSHLSARLPEYMIPSYFMFLPVLPLTPNGKIDRKAFPDPEVRTGSDHIAPVNDTEEQLAGIWAEILKTDKSRISVTDDFFRLGGHSLNAMIAVARMEKQLGRSIPLKKFYAISTIRETARYIDAHDLPADAYGGRQKDIIPAPQKEYYPLSSQQKRMYFLHELDASSLAYNETGIYVLSGELDANRLSAAFGQLIQRHEVLRTSFWWRHDQPVQKIEAAAPFAIDFFKADGQEQQRIKDFIRPFDLKRPPLMRAAIVERERGEYLLIVDMHHIITDGISKGILVHDFMALYQEKELPAPVLHYKDYVEWMLNAQQQVMARQKAFWLDLFATEAPLLNLATDLARPSRKSHAGKVLSFSLGRPETERLRHLAQEQRTTLYMVLLAVFNVTLSKLSNQEDIVIGTPTAGRRHADLEKVMGMFVDTIPLRNHPRGDLSFRSFLQDVRVKTTECFDNQDYPYEELIDELKLERDPGRNPLFDVFFVFHNFDMFELKIPGLSLFTYERTSETSKFDLTLEVFEKDDDIVLNVEYATDLFRQATIERLTSVFQKVTGVAIADPGRKIADINILSPQEEELLLHGFNDTAAAYPDQETIPSLFEKQALQTPENIAYRYGELTVTYRELSGKADRLAACLAEVHSIQTGDLIGLMLGRDEYLIPALFGILKAGGAYVPIDPDYPAERIQAILLDAKIKVVITKSIYRHILTDARAIASAPEYSAALPGIAQSAPGSAEAAPAIIASAPAIIELDTDWPAIEAHPLTPMGRKAGPGDLAYIIYTSGSTGRPKGVMIEHHSVVNRLNWMQKQYPIGPGDVLLQKTPIVFDVSVWELFWWSFTGASLSILPPEAEKDPHVITRTIDSHHVTVIHFVPSMFSAWLSSLAAQTESGQVQGAQEVAVREATLTDALQTGNLKAGGAQAPPKNKHSLQTLRFLFTSGEALKPAQVNLFQTIFTRIPSTRLINLYGPTEATVDVTFYECPREEAPQTSPPQAIPPQTSPPQTITPQTIPPHSIPLQASTSQTIPIGKPIDNIRMYILDKYDQPVPIGVPAELCIAGTGLARGYLNNEALTAQKFVAFRNERIYRTGDLAKWMPDGNIAFLGRLDHQVKVRGFRIELEEIEGWLMREGRIKEATVIAREKKEDNYLIAYYVSEQPLEARELRHYLSGRLPAYMIPAYFVHLTHFPLTTNGKLDRKALPDPEPGQSHAYTAPEGQVEERLTEIWAQALQIDKEKLSRDSSFFELGGHSIKAIQIMDEVSKAFSVQAGLRTIFEHNTIQELGSMITARQTGAAAATPAGSSPAAPGGAHTTSADAGKPPAGVITYLGDQPDYLVSSAQERLFFENLLNQDRLTANISLAYSIDGEPDPGRLNKALSMLPDRHASLRTRFLLSDKGLVQVIDPRATLAVRELEAGKYRTVEEAFRDFIRPFDLSNPPLIRCGLLQDPLLGKFLFVDIHHIICDGISVNILMNDFKNAYQGIPLPPLPLRYVDYANWQRQQEDGSQQRELFWKEQLRGFRPGIELPILRDRESAPVYSAARSLLTIDRNQYRKIKDFTSKANVSDFIFLLSVYSLVLSKISGRTDLLIGTDAIGRTMPSLAGIVGTFVNILPLRLRIPEKSSFSDFLLTVRDCVLNAFEHQEVPFERILWHAEAEPEGRLIEVFFSYRKLMESQADLSGLELTPLRSELRPATARYELEMDAEPDQDGLRLTLLYSTDLYDEQTVGMLLNGYSNILTAVLDAPAIFIEKIEIKTTV